MDCVFCLINEGKIPSKKIYEDDLVFAILDISQATYGHTLVIPKKHYESIYDMPEDLYLHLQKVVLKLANEISNKLNASGLNIINNNKPAAGQVVNHFHVHIIPRYDGDDLKIIQTNHEYNLDEIFNILK